MRRLLRSPKALILTPLLLVLVFIVACGGSEATTAPEADATAVTTVPGVPTATPEPTVPQMVVRTRGGVIPMQDYAFPNLAFHPHGGVTQVKNYSPIYNQLVEYNPETADSSDIRCDLCTSWDVTDGGATYIFKLNESAMWHNGTPVTAADVVYSIDSMVDPDASRPITRSGLGTYYSPGNARAIDESTVEIKLNFAAGEFLPIFAIDLMKIISKDYVESLGDDFDKWENAMGSGPFKPGPLEKDVSIELVRNDDYFKDGLPYIDGQKHILIVDKGTVTAAYKTGQVLMPNWNVTHLNNKESVLIAEETKDVLTLVAAPNYAFIGLLINATVEPFDDIRVRQALNLAMWRQPFVELFGAGAEIDNQAPAMGAGTWFGRTPEEISNLPGYRELNGEKHPDDIAAARALLADAGFPDGFKTTLMHRIVLDFPDIALIQKEQLKKYLNIDVTIQPEESAAGDARFNALDYALGAQGTGHTLTEPDAILTQVWMPGGLWNGRTKWGDDHAPQWFKDAYNEQAAEVDRVKRKVILTKMEDYLINEDPGPFVILYWSGRSVLINKKIQGFNMGYGLFLQMKHETLWCDPKC